MNKDGSNLSKPRFGCCFRGSFYILSRTYLLYLGTRGLSMIREKVEKVQFLIWNMKKRFLICDLESLNGAPGSVRANHKLWTLSNGI